MLNKLPFSTDL